jgi:hypothetical protein
LIRLVLFTGGAFAAGVMYQWSGASTACKDAGGIIKGGICRGVAIDG